MLDEMPADAGDKVTLVLALEVPDEVLTERICGQAHKVRPLVRRQVREAQVPGRWRNPKP